MSGTNRVVAHFLDGRVLKGITVDFFTNRPQFHVQFLQTETQQTVECRQLKALFFVKDFAGNPQRQDKVSFDQATGDRNQGKKVAVVFKDGEIISGYTLSYTADGDGFFVSPADPDSNNIRIYVFRHATQNIALGDEAEALVKKFPKAA